MDKENFKEEVLLKGNYTNYLLSVVASVLYKVTERNELIETSVELSFSYKDTSTRNEIRGIKEIFK